MNKEESESEQIRKMNVETEDYFYLHNLVCHICTSYYFNQTKYADSICLRNYSKFLNSQLINLIINIYVFNIFRQEYKIEKSKYEIDEPEETGGWNKIENKTWNNNVSCFEYYNEEIINIENLYTHFLIKSYPFIMYDLSILGESKGVLRRDNFLETYGNNVVIDTINNKQMTISDYLSNMNEHYFFHQGKDGMELNFFHTYYKPPKWYINYTSHWGNIMTNDNNTFEFRKSCTEKDNKIILRPQLYFGGYNLGTFFETSVGFIDTLVYGKRRWFIFDPNMYILIYNSGLKNWDGECGNIGKWLEYNYESLDPKPYECIQSQDETIFIPAGWYCMSIAIKECIGIRLNIGIHKIVVDNFFNVHKNLTKTDMVLE